MAMMAAIPKTKDGWLRRLKRTSLPSFGESVKMLSSNQSFSAAHSAELTRTILKDPALTAAVLKLANSVQFNTYGNPIRTISRAVMVLGEQSIKDICASCLLLDKLGSQGSASSVLKAILARSFHAAIQAKEIASLYIKGQSSNNAQSSFNLEETFIATLLINIGEVAVYASLANEEMLMAKLARHYPFDGGKEKDIIGCYFNELTLSLCHSWGISPMISDVIKGNYSDNSPHRSVLLASSLALTCEKQGLSKGISVHMKALAKYSKQDAETLNDKLTSAGQTAQQCLQSFGLELDGFQKSENEKNNQRRFEIKISRQHQLDAIFELASLVQNSFDINHALELLLEGLSRGGGFNCALVGLYDPNRIKLVAKHCIEIQSSHIKDNFNFDCARQIPEIQNKVLTNQGVLSLDELRENGATKRRILSQLEHTQSIWGPLIVEDKVIGCLYADNGNLKDAVSPEQIAVFKLFVYQARCCLNRLR